MQQQQLDPEVLKAADNDYFTIGGKRYAYHKATTQQWAKVTKTDKNLFRELAWIFFRIPKKRYELLPVEDITLAISACIYRTNNGRPSVAQELSDYFRLGGKTRGKSVETSLVIEQYATLKNFGIKPWELGDGKPYREDMVLMNLCKGLHSQYHDRWEVNSGGGTLQQKGIQGSTVAERVRAQKIQQLNAAARR